MRLRHLLMASAFWCLVGVGVTGEAIGQSAGTTTASLITLLEAGDTAALTRFLTQRPSENLNQILANGETPLTLAVRSGSLQAIAFLLSRQVDPNGTNELGLRPLHLAVVFGNADRMALHPRIGPKR
jgi:ankyrin repeat protein